MQKSTSLNYLLVFTTFTLSYGNNTPDLVTHVQKSIQAAEISNSKLDSEILGIYGYSSSKVRHFLNNLCSLPGARYLEIGVWKGSTFISALYNNTDTICDAIAIDQWFDAQIPLLNNEKESFIANTAKFLPSKSFKLFEQDAFAITPEDICSPASINIYFYDGDHSEKAQYQAFVHYDKILAHKFIAIVDDWNWLRVQQGTKRAFSDLKYKIIFEIELPSNGNCDTANWWNGLYVAIIEKTN